MTRKEALTMLRTNQYVVVRLPPRSVPIFDRTRVEQCHRENERDRQAVQPFSALFSDGLCNMVPERCTDEPYREMVYQISERGLRAVSESNE
jgi:hypothetical protein